jgi:hypothetical protein
MADDALGAKPARMKMSDVMRYVGGVTRGARQPVREVKIDPDGNLTMVMVDVREPPILVRPQPQTPQDMQEQLAFEATEAEQISRDQDG